MPQSLHPLAFPALRALAAYREGARMGPVLQKGDVTVQLAGESCAV